MAEKHGGGIDLRQLDRRVVERYLKTGKLDEKEYQKYLKTLPDLTEGASKVDTEFEPAGELGPSR
jgi:hypothetical protein